MKSLNSILILRLDKIFTEQTMASHTELIKRKKQEIFSLKEELLSKEAELEKLIKENVREGFTLSQK